MLGRAQAPSLRNGLKIHDAICDHWKYRSALLAVSEGDEMASDLGDLMLARVLGAAIALVLCATEVSAQTSLVTPYPGYTYFNRANATQAEHDAELRTCIGLAARLVQPDPTAGAGAGGGLLGALVVGVVRGMQQGMTARRGVVANTANCMVLNGWRLVQVDETLGAELAELEQPALAERLAPMIGAAEPTGVIVRTFHNEAAVREVAVYGPAGDLDKIPLSFQALAPVEEDEQATAAAAEPASERPRLRRPRSAANPRPLSSRDIAALTPESTLVVVNIAGTLGLGGTSLSFARLGDGEIAPGYVDGLPDRFIATLPQPAFALASRPHEVTRVFEVPPGRWALTSLGISMWTTHFCFGAPFFEIAAGEVVFIRLDLLADARVPSYSPEAAAAAMAEFPSHVLERARAAAFTNGHPSTCGGSSAFYAWEIPGAPYLETYAVGSRHISLMTDASARVEEAVGDAASAEDAAPEAATPTETTPTEATPADAPATLDAAPASPSP